MQQEKYYEVYHVGITLKSRPTGNEYIRTCNESGDKLVFLIEYKNKTASRGTKRKVQNMIKEMLKKDKDPSFTTFINTVYYWGRPSITLSESKKIKNMIESGKGKNARLIKY